ncbi:hypothetical protein E2C01_031230 [Portunus trituberculatus]|uniref:Uncharacterized protein n=1 Tax=Portunus trituberculatus TaxID=210409 RepID=A0A5B7ESG3_PORTR|nr:hypothetical protein [Portunus trituberculatus]
MRITGSNENVRLCNRQIMAHGNIKEDFVNYVAAEVVMVMMVVIKMINTVLMPRATRGDSGCNDTSSGVVLMPMVMQGQGSGGDQRAGEEVMI